MGLNELGKLCEEADYLHMHLAKLRRFAKLSDCREIEEYFYSQIQVVFHQMERTRLDMVSLQGLKEAEGSIRREVENSYESLIDDKDEMIASLLERLGDKQE